MRKCFHNWKHEILEFKHAPYQIWRKFAPQRWQYFGCKLEPLFLTVCNAPGMVIFLLSSVLHVVITWVLSVCSAWVNLKCITRENGTRGSSYMSNHNRRMFSFLSLLRAAIKVKSNYSNTQSNVSCKLYTHFIYRPVIYHYYYYIDIYAWYIVIYITFYVPSILRVNILNWYLYSAEKNTPLGACVRWCEMVPLLLGAKRDPSSNQIRQIAWKVSARLLCSHPRI